MFSPLVSKGWRTFKHRSPGCERPGVGFGSLNDFVTGLLAAVAAEAGEG